MINVLGKRSELAIYKRVAFRNNADPSERHDEGAAPGLL
jgi:hypothetical protein